MTFTYERNFIYIYDSINTGIKAGDFSIIYMSPETLFNSDLWGDMILNSEVYKERVCLIAIDEAHILESWKEFDIEIGKAIFKKKIHLICKTIQSLN